MYRPAVLLLSVVVVGVVGAGAVRDAKEWASLRASTTVIANRILDEIVEKALANIVAKGWDVSKNVQNGVATFPLSTDSSGNVNETFSITNAFIKGLGSLARSRSASLDTAREVVSGTLKLEDVSLTADFVINFPGAGQANPENRSGKITVEAERIFAEIDVNVDQVNSAWVPQNIADYDVPTAYVTIESVTNMNGGISAIHMAGMRKALRQVLENTMNANIKVQVNQAIQTIKANAAAGK